MDTRLVIRIDLLGNKKICEITIEIEHWENKLFISSQSGPQRWVSAKLHGFFPLY